MRAAFKSTKVMLYLRAVFKSTKIMLHLMQSSVQKYKDHEAVLV